MRKSLPGGLGKKTYSKMQKHEKAISKIKITQLGQGMARSPTEIRIKGQEQTKW